MRRSWSRESSQHATTATVAEARAYVAAARPLADGFFERIEGWFSPLDGDTTGLVSVLQMTFKGSQPMTMSELSTLSPDGTRRMRVAPLCCLAALSLR